MCILEPGLLLVSDLILEPISGSYTFSLCKLASSLANWSVGVIFNLFLKKILENVSHFSQSSHPGNIKTVQLESSSSQLTVKMHLQHILLPTHKHLKASQAVAVSGYTFVHF